MSVDSDDLLAWPDPVVAHRAHRRLAGVSEDDPDQQRRRRLVAWQWQDGGWNCDRDPSARTSSVQETLLPLRGLARHAKAGHGTAAVDGAVDHAVEFLLARRLLWRCHDGAPIRPTWGRDPLLIHWPIRCYDVLSALTVMTELERIHDPAAPTP